MNLHDDCVAIQGLRGRRRRITSTSRILTTTAFSTRLLSELGFIRCHTVPLSDQAQDVMQSKLVQWQHNYSERKAAIWFEKYWTGDRGNWSKAHGVGGTDNNNGTEGRWEGSTAEKVMVYINFA